MRDRKLEKQIRSVEGFIKKWKKLNKADGTERYSEVDFGDLFS